MKIHETVKIFPGAHVIGDVKIDENSSIWYNAVLRGDHGDIKVGKNSNVQDNCVIHAPPVGTTLIGDHVSIGHGAIVHGCEIGDNVTIGMNATILNRAKIGKNSLVGAGALVTEDKEFPEGSLILGLPAKVIRELTPEEIVENKTNAEKYVDLAKKH
ncbi:2,3,4,5-tetrahydropyridine-2,6-dicarboxylate N-acetyltransferase [Methanobrevibacter cuticularis]|uniref:2,3,4,5-tetrahydropyridine-2,6-dicarboxylate N-acetyltransferase n=1 Tax=Methanobrevibacter cuticularis TaxID=47311 RepID=A0A166DML9_9EURY|nr:gamma carbonic anhydrase family protein [Methanobrevibacter cuticularis]KZX15762.1 2,3,4,5-tetrahydropyridine-2,6-dicarboxylate N-acetyltransferase [Methanobrevibacter cuticularis]